MFDTLRLKFIFSLSQATSFLEHHKKQQSLILNYFSTKAFKFADQLKFKKEDLIKFIRLVYEQYESIKKQLNEKAMDEIYISKLYTMNKESRTKLGNGDLGKLIKEIRPRTRFEKSSAIHGFLERDWSSDTAIKREKIRIDFLRMSEEETQKISRNLKVRLDERALEALIKYKCEIVIQFICKIIMFENNLLVGEMDNDDLKSIVDLVVEGNQMARNKVSIFVI